MILGVVVLLATISNFGVLNYLVYPSFIELEQVESQRNLKRARDAIQNELLHLSTFVWDWAAWDDTYEYVENQNQEYVDSNLVESSFYGNNMNLIMFYNINGELIWGQIHDLILEDEIEFGGIPSISLSPNHSLLSHSTIESAPTGVMLTKRGPILIASRPIVNSEEEGPIRGTLVMGKFLSGPVIESLQEQTGVEFQVWPLDEISGAPIEQEALAQLGTGKQIVLRETGDDVLAAYSLLLDYENRPAVLLRADTPRSISAVGIQTLNAALLGILAAGVISLIVMAVLQGHLVTGPLIRLTDHVLAIGSSADLSKRLEVRRTDELGVLATEFDHMLERLSDVRERLLEQSYQSGIADMSAGVLHNLRNRLSTLVTRLGNLGSLATASPKNKVDAALAELSLNDSLPEREAKLVEYLKQVTKTRSEAEQRMRQEIHSMERQINLIDEVLTKQDEFARAARVIAPVEISGILTKTARMMPDDTGRNTTLKFDPNIEHLPAVLAESFVLSQVLQNLFINATEAIRGAGKEDGYIEVTAGLETEADGRQMVHVEITDNGVGIEPENLSTIFQRDFTTKEEGKGGLGLHWCANSILALQGKIYAESKGPGQGAKLHVILPAAAEGIESAA
jgi:sensor domain CHASE-containing protein